MKKQIIILSILFSGISLSAQVTIGSEIQANTGTLVDMKEFANTNALSDGNSTASKGMNLPRVALINKQLLEPCVATNTTNKKNHTGLMVYNTTDNAYITPGIHYWDGGEWKQMITAIPRTQLNVQNLTTSVSSTVGDNYATGGTNLTFETIVIPEDGSYAFDFRFYGDIAGIPTTATVGTRCVYYLTLWANGTLKDIAEINITGFPPTGYRYTYSVALGADLDAGDNITFKLSHYTTTPYSWTLRAGNNTTAARSSMIWWKL